MSTPIEEIREAVRALREIAGEATSGPWRTVIDDSESRHSVARRCDSPDHPSDDTDQVWMYDCCDGYVAAAFADANADYAALMDPPVALALADWLEHDAEILTRRYGAEVADFIAPGHSSLMVARAVLKRESGS